MSALNRSLLAWLTRAFTAPAGETDGQAGGFGFLCCGLAAGPWPTQGEAECLAGIHDRLHHGSHTGSRVAKVVPAADLPVPTAGPHSPSWVQITADSGMSVGGGQR